MDFTCAASVSEFEFYEHSVSNLAHLESTVWILLKTEKQSPTHVKHQHASNLANLSTTVLEHTTVDHVLTG